MSHGTYSGSYSSLAVTYSGPVTITPTGVVNDLAGTLAVYIGFHAVTNRGTISAAAYGADGVLSTGGAFTNAGSVAANGGKGIGVAISQATILTNQQTGSIKATGDSGVGIYLQAGGTIVNQAGGKIEATGTHGYAIDLGHGGSVSNAGSILSFGVSGVGIDLKIGGGIGSSGLIEAGYIGIYSTAATITNSGTIDATDISGQGVSMIGGVLTNTGIVKATYTYGIAVDVRTAASVTNGPAGTIEATDKGGIGIYVHSGGTVANSVGGAIQSNGYSGYGVFLDNGGTISNAGKIEADGTGGIAVVLHTAGSIYNIGLIRAVKSGVGIYGSNGLVTNGGTVAGVGYGIKLNTGTVTNFGTIDASSNNGYAIQFSKGGTITNDVAGVLLGGGGIAFGGAAGTLVNYGRIQATGTSSTAVSLNNGGFLKNKAGALIEGFEGAAIAGLAGTVINGGTIASTAVTGGEALSLGEQGDVLKWKAGGVFIGSVDGGGGTLVLTAGVGVGTLSGLGGSIFNFNGGTLGVNASWAFAGTDSFFTGQTFTSRGTLTQSGTLQDNGAVILDGSTSLGGTVSGHGTLEIGGLGYGVTLASGAALTVAMIELDPAASIMLDTSLDYAGTLSAAQGTIRLHGYDLTLSGSNSFNGTKISGKSDLVTKLGTTTVGSIAITSGTWANSGLVDVTGTGLTLGAPTYAASFINQTHGTLDLRGDGSISIGTFAGDSVANSALIEKTGGTGTSLIGATVTNNGTIAVATGTLDLGAAVTGSGTLLIAGASTLEFGSSVISSEKLSFSGSSETVRLADAAGFAATISGFGAGDRLDFIGYGAGTTVSFTAAAGNTGGTLTVANGTTKASIKLFGQYSNAGFGTASDGSGGTVVTYTPPAALTASLAPPH